MNESPGIYWIQGLVDGEWSNLLRCDDHADAVSRIGRMTGDKRYGELRLVLARQQRGEFEYTTLATIRDGEIVSGSPLFDSLLPASKAPKPAPAGAAKPSRWRLPLFAVILVAAIGAGLAIARQHPDLALAAYRKLGLAADAPAHAGAIQQAAVPKGSYSDRLFDAVDADDGARIRQLMVSRPGDLHLDGLRLFVDDSWATGPRKIVDYALLGGHLKAADALLSAGAVPSKWLLQLMQQHPDDPHMKAATVVLSEFGPIPRVSLNSTSTQTSREIAGTPPN